MSSFDSSIPWLLFLLVPCVAFLYASAGFGGASGYLAAMAYFMLPPEVMSSTALTLNLLVASLAFLTYYQKQHFNPRLLFPFLLTSIPAAFLGGFIDISLQLYLALLYLSLTFISLRLLFSRSNLSADQTSAQKFPLWIAFLAGGPIGLLSGIIGIGGGIFLAPLILLTGWGTPKQAAASSAGFIWINSLSGLVGRLVGGNLELGLLGLLLIPVGLAGAVGGSRIGAHYLSNQSLLRVIGLILLIAVARFWVGILG